MIHITENLKGARQQIMINHIENKMLIIGDEGEEESKWRLWVKGILLFRMLIRFIMKVQSVAMLILCLMVVRMLESPELYRNYLQGGFEVSCDGCI